MGQQRIRKKKRRLFRKPDAVIVTLTTVTILLLLVWGGLHWKESSKQALSVHANGEEQGEQAQQEAGGQQISDSEDLNAGGDEQSSATVDNSVQQPADKPDVNGGESQSKATEPTQETATKPDVPSPTKSEPSSPAKSEAPSPAKSEAPSPVKSEAPSPTKSEPSSSTETEPSINHVQIYEQEIIQVQASCTKDMNEVLSRAESSIQKLDKTDPVAVQAWKENLTKEILAAESICDGEFQVVSQNAENDSVSPKVIEEWKQTFIKLKEKLRGESQAKLQQFMGG